MAAKTGTYSLINSTTLGSAQGSVTFSSIPSTYTDLILVCNAGCDAGGKNIQFRFNSDTSTNYSSMRLLGNGSIAYSDRTTNASVMNSANCPTTLTGTTVINIMNYANTTTYKTAITRSNDAGVNLGAIIGLWRSTSAISSIVLSPEFTNNFLSGSTFKLYGIEAGNL